MIAALMLASAASFSGVAHVVDGDSLWIGSDRVRLSGVDAPELSQRCGTGARQSACGRVAAAWLRARAEGRRVDCVEVDRDRYARRVAVCRLDGADLGAALVEAGWATAYRRYSLAYVDGEGRARAAVRGIWALGFEPPARYRRERRLAAGTPPRPGSRCVVKGNVSAGGERIFHVPGSRDYRAVRIDEGRGERWFCSAEQASAAGWRPPR